MKIVLTAVDAELADAWEKFCGDLDFVSIYRGSILNLQHNYDAIVSPANSYGFMDGGIDQLYSWHFGWQLQENLQRLIQEKHHGELLVGTAEIVPTGKPHIPYVIAAPTMRVPMSLKNSVNPYLAARAVFLLVKYGQFSIGEHQGQPISNVVETVAFPGLGTGVGGIGFNTCAHQVRAAIDEVILQKNRYPFTWVEAQERHQRLYRDLIRDLQFEE